MNTLIKEIKKQANAYYNGVPKISDKEFDQLVEKLKSINPNHPILSTPGWGYEPAGKKYKHCTLIGSLNKIKIDTIEAKQNFLNSSYCNYMKYAITPKLDGGSVVVYYEDGNLSRIVSRGNGLEGVDVTKVVASSQTIPLRVSKYIKAVRGEVVISKKNFKEHLKDNYANARNAAVGISQSIDSKNAKYLEFVAYNLIYSDSSINVDYVQELIKLYDEGFKVVPILIINNIKQLEFFSPATHDYFYDTDGLVVCKLNVNRENGIAKYDSFAVKYEEETAITKVIDVDWELTKLGKLSPVICFEPVELSGATISRCSGFNARFIQENNIGTGAVIKVCRANEVIPHILETIEPGVLTLPQEWKDGEYIYWDGVDLKVNVDKEKYAIKNLIESTLEFGFGESLVNTIIEEFQVKTFKRLLEIASSEYVNKYEEYINKSFTERISTAIKNLLTNVFTIPRTLNEILVMANIKGLGETASEIIAANCTRQELIIMLETYKGLSPELEQKLPTYIPGESIRKNYKFLLDYLGLPFIDKEYKSISYNSKVIKIALTGKLSKPRSELLKEWFKYNVTEVDINNANYLITNNPNSSSSKNKRATQLGIPKLTEQQFEKIIYEH